MESHLVYFVDTERDTGIMRAIDKFQPITLEEMKQVSLMNRVDTKYITTAETVEKLLTLASDDFYIQEIDGIRQSAYYTIYYDTESRKMYYEHQRGKKPRQKIRVREYVDSGTHPFLEIKNKNNKGRTKKKRMEMEEGKSVEDYKEFIEKHTGFEASDLIPAIENRFKRITMVNRNKTERITIDTSLEFHNFATGISREVPRLAIIEWKRDALAAGSPLKRLLRQLRIKESGFSKYAIGMALTDPSLRQNRLKQRLRLVDKIIC